MADKITTLHPVGSPEVNIYPNIKTENIPDGSITPDKMAYQVYCTNFYIIDQDPDYVRFFVFTPFKMTDYREFLDFFEVGEEINCQGTMNQEDIVKGRITYFNGSKYLEVETTNSSYLIRHDSTPFNCNIVWNRVF